eukprot:2626058-Alexandrium_andersonii.AAC.1
MKSEAWMWYRSHPALVDLPFVEGDAAAHLMSSARVASLWRELTRSRAQPPYVALPELLALIAARAFWAEDLAKMKKGE